jgi:nucleoid DNA-binding protein
MLETLYLFLIRHKQIELPEIGVVSVHIQSAKTKFIDREVLPPGYSFAFSSRVPHATNKLTGWIAHALDISETEAISRFNNFIYEIKMQLQDGKEVVWKGVGKFSKDLMNEIKFEPQKRAFAFQQPVIAEKVIRENAKHAVLVGEREKTASEYSEIIEEREEPTTRSNWWIWPVALIVLSLIFIGWYFSENGIKASSSSNTERSTPKTAPSGFYYSK